MIKMIKPFMCAALFAFLPAPILAEGEPGGNFDYYVLSLSWTPSWCAETGDSRGSPQCRAGKGYGFEVHGLWPQYENGWPSYCRTGARDPSRSTTANMTDIMGSSGSAWYQWKKHGRCAGLSADDFYATVRAAYAAVNRPDVFRSLSKSVALPASVVEAAFLEANPDMAADGVTVTCKNSHIQEVRICLSKDLTPRACGADTRQDCTLQNAMMDPIR